MTLTSRRVRCRTTVGAPFASSPLTDVFTTQGLESVRGNNTTFQFGFFDPTGAVLDLTGVQSINLKIQPSQTVDGVLVDQTTTTFDNTLTTSTWADLSKQHVVFALTSAQTNLALGGAAKRDLWLVLTAITTAGAEITLAGGTFTLHEDNNGSTATPPAYPGAYLTVDQGDARYPFGMTRATLPANGVTLTPNYLQTALSPANTNLRFSQVSTGVAPKISYAAATTGSVVVTGSSIVVTIASTAGVSSLTAAAVKSQIEASSSAMALISVAHAAGSDGSGVIGSGFSFATTYLAGGYNSSDVIITCASTSGLVGTYVVAGTTNSKPTYHKNSTSVNATITWNTSFSGSYLVWQLYVNGVMTLESADDVSTPDLCTTWIKVYPTAGAAPSDYLVVPALGTTAPVTTLCAVGGTDAYICVRATPVSWKHITVS